MDNTPAEEGRRKRVRDTGIVVGSLPTGLNNAITDVAGVRVGHTTLIRGEGALQPGKGPVRTGVTVILPHAGDIYRKKVRAAVHTINGHGKVHGFEQVRELGVIESPIALTNTFNVGLVSDALIQYMTSRDPSIGASEGSLSLNVVVGETNDSYLNDMPGRHVKYDHVLAAIQAALAGSDRSPVTEGCLGAGTGTHCFNWKGGIGTASRVIPHQAGGFAVGALVQSNFGLAEQLTICGVPVGKFILPPGKVPAPKADPGSIMIVLATDAPLSELQLRRLCVRVSVGLAHTGSQIGHMSGDFVIAFSTGGVMEHQPAALVSQISALTDEAAVMPWLFSAVIESVEEAVINSMFQAKTSTGRDGNTLTALPVEEVCQLVKKHRGL